MNDNHSRLSPVGKGGPQDSCRIPAVFITYYSDIWSFVTNSIRNFFVDDLACRRGENRGQVFDPMPGCGPPEYSETQSSK